MVNFNIPPPLTISLSPIHIPLLFPFFLYFFHCLLLPLHSPINSSLILLFKTHPNGEGQTLLFLFSISHHIFHSLILWIFKTSRRRRRRLHRHHQPYFNITIPINTLSSRFGLLVVKDSSLWLQDLHAIHTVYFDLAFKFIPLCCLFIYCIS